MVFLSCLNLKMSLIEKFLLEVVQKCQHCVLRENLNWSGNKHWSNKSHGLSRFSTKPALSMIFLIWILFNGKMRYLQKSSSITPDSDLKKKLEIHFNFLWGTIISGQRRISPSTLSYINPSATTGGSRISPRRGRQLPGGRQHTNLPNFPKNCMKLKEFGPPGGARPSHPP